MEVNVRVLRATVIDGHDVHPGQKVKVSVSKARRLIAMGKVEEVKRGRPRKGEVSDDQQADADAIVDDLEKVDGKA